MRTGVGQCVRVFSWGAHELRVEEEGSGYSNYGPGKGNQSLVFLGRRGDHYEATFSFK